MNNIKMDVIPEFLIGTLFSKQSTIALNNSKFHKVFFKMKKKTEYAGLFESILFSGSPVNPFSEALDEALFNLQFSGALSRKNPELVMYSTTDSFNYTYRILVKDVKPEVIEKTEQLCDEILDMLKT
ncbi:MAG: hypothetical protein LBS04_06030 [Tannerellaceae bacterium]|jgi:hypothetical protein|nr:hypothetical protein [Tannerellaceae bacterium]